MIFMSESLRSSSSAYYNEIGNRVGSIICDNFQLEVAMYLCTTPRLLCSLILFTIQSILVWPHVSSSVCVYERMKIENRSIYFGHFITQ